MLEIQNDGPCLICGGTSYTWGKAQGQYDLKFKADDAFFLEKWTVFGGSEVRARACNGCGNIQLFALDFGRQENK